MTDTLTETLAAIETNGGFDAFGNGYTKAIHDAIAIIRQHHAKQPNDTNSPVPIHRPEQKMQTDTLNELGFAEAMKAYASIAEPNNIAMQKALGAYLLASRCEIPVIELGVIEHLVKREIPALTLEIAETIANVEDGAEVDEITIGSHLLPEIDATLERARYQLESVMLATKPKREAQPSEISEDVEEASWQAINDALAKQNLIGRAHTHTYIARKLRDDRD